MSIDMRVRHDQRVYADETLGGRMQTFLRDGSLTFFSLQLKSPFLFAVHEKSSNTNGV